MTLRDWFRPRYRHSDLVVRHAAIDKIQDETKLRELYAEQPRGEWWIRGLIATKLRDETLMAEVLLAQNFPDNEPVIDPKLVDATIRTPALWRALVRPQVAQEIRLLAARKLGDFETIHSLVRETTQAWVFTKALEALPDSAIDCALLGELDRICILRPISFPVLARHRAKDAGWSLKQIQCPTCSGLGRTSFTVAGVDHPLENYAMPFYSGERSCNECGGSGNIPALTRGTETVQAPHVGREQR